MGQWEYCAVSEKVQINRMYSMEHLLDLVNGERAEELRLRVGAPPVVVLEGQEHRVEDYAITARDAEQLLRSIANSRQMRELREQGIVQFLYNFRRFTPFLIQAHMENNCVGIRVQ